MFCVFIFLLCISFYLFPRKRFKHNAGWFGELKHAIIFVCVGYSKLYFDFNSKKKKINPRFCFNSIFVAKNKKIKKPTHHPMITKRVHVRSHSCPVDIWDFNTTRTNGSWHGYKSMRKFKKLLNSSQVAKKKKINK